MKTEEDLPDERLAQAWRPAVQAEYGVTRSRFYELRSFRDVAARVRPGPRPSAPVVATRAALKRKAVDLHKPVMTQRKPREGQIKYVFKRRKLCTLYRVGEEVVDRLLAKIMIAQAFTREFSRVGIDPNEHVIRWTSAFHVADDFYIK